MKSRVLSPKATATAISEALAEKYAAPVWSYLEQVASGTGATWGRYADAVAMGLWPSRGLELLGFEIKVGRGDWLHELRQPEKADAIAKYCSRWWIVTTPDVVKVEELPVAWGLQVLKDGKLKVIREAPIKKARALDRTIVAAIMRRLQEKVAKSYVPKAAIQARLDKARSEGEASARESEKWETRSDRERLRRLEESLSAFEMASGIKIDQWSAFGSEKMGEAVKYLINKGPKRVFRDMASAREILARVLLDLDRRTIALAEEIADGEVG